MKLQTILALKWGAWIKGAATVTLVENGKIEVTFKTGSKQQYALQTDECDSPVGTVVTPAQYTEEFNNVLNYCEGNDLMRTMLSLLHGRRSSKQRAIVGARTLTEEIYLYTAARKRAVDWPGLAEGTPAVLTLQDQCVSVAGERIWNKRFPVTVTDTCTIIDFIIYAMDDLLANGKGYRDFEELPVNGLVRYCSNMVLGAPYVMPTLKCTAGADVNTLVLWRGAMQAVLVAAQGGDTDRQISARLDYTDRLIAQANRWDATALQRAGQGAGNTDPSYEHTELAKPVQPEVAEPVTREILEQNVNNLLARLTNGGL